MMLYSIFKKKKKKKKKKQANKQMFNSMKFYCYIYIYIFSVVQLDEVKTKGFCLSDKKKAGLKLVVSKLSNVAKLFKNFSQEILIAINRVFIRQFN